MRHLIMFLLLSLSCGLSTAWELEKNEDEIKVYTQSVEGSNFRAFKGETHIQASLTQILTHHLNVESMTEWLQDCSESELLGQINDNEFIVYQRTEAPWPVSDRDYVMHARIEQDPTSYIVTMTFTAQADATEHDDECVQVTQLKGHWRFTPIEEGRVFIEYETHADPAGQLPSWLANSFVVDQPFGTLSKLKQRVEKGKQAEQVHNIGFISEPPKGYFAPKE